jgi:predicted transcriptional regulator
MSQTYNTVIQNITQYLILKFLNNYGTTDIQTISKECNLLNINNSIETLVSQNLLKKSTVKNNQYHITDEGKNTLSIINNYLK